MGLKNVYLLGAGFTRAVMGDIAPLNDDIMNSLDVGLFPCFKEEYETAKSNIEQFLTLVDLKTLRFQEINNRKSKELDEAQKQIIESIISMVDIDKLNISNCENKSILMAFVNSISDGSCLVSLNYDCVVDQGLWLDGRWHPADGYNLTTLPATTDGRTRLLLLKVHGSCNFSTISQADEYALVSIHDRLFPGIHSNINTPIHNPRLVAMTFIKKYNNDLMMLWSKAISEMASADNLVIIGCSVREEDAFLKFAIYHFGMKKKDKNDDFNIDIVGVKKEELEKIRSKVEKMVARPGQHKFTLYTEGLAGYLNDIHSN